MADLRSVLDEAAQAELISVAASERLLPFLSDRGVVVRETIKASAPERPATPADELLSPEPDTETPRFVRGFHDILITIGVVVLLSGLWGLASLYVVLPAIIVLSEVLVQRQRLALPAVALTFSLVVWTAQFVTVADPAVRDIWRGGDFPILYLAAFPILLGLYHARYRVPLSFALSVNFGLCFLLAVIFRLVQRVSGDPLFPFDRPGVLGAILLFSALSLFAVALYFDLRDTRRVTRNSDIAFWLHLVTAPALLYSTIFVMLPEGSLFNSSEALSARTPIVVITVAVMMLIGLIIDRRAFVTAGMLSLGAAIYGVFRNGGARVDTYLFMTLLIIGSIVLVIGIGWVPLRRCVLRLLPVSVSGRLPRAL